MNENSIKELTLPDLLRLSEHAINELLSMHQLKDTGKNIKNKQKEIELLQKIIASKKSTDQPP